MKKVILLFVTSLLIFACNKDEIEVEQTTVDSTFTLGSINPLSTPNAEFDNSSMGMYHGVIVSEDAEFHGKIWINVGNDGNYNATVETFEGQKVAFFAENSSNISNVISFVGTRGSFDLDVTQYGVTSSTIANSTFKPIITNVMLDNVAGAISAYKEKSNQRAMAILGTYVDGADPAFTGTWDLISDGTIHPVNIGLAGVVVQEVMVVAPGAGIFSDISLETFDFSCYGGTAMAPYLFLDAGVNNEIAIFEQTSTFGQSDATYDLGVSVLIRDGNNLGYPDVINRNVAGTLGCFITSSQGTWAWNGRSGTISFPVDVPLPALACGDTFADTGGTIIGYRADESFVRTISRGDAVPLTMYFSEFDLMDDTLSIYDGADTGAPLIGTFTAADLLGVQLDGTGDTLTFEFTSNGSLEGTGWAAEVCGVTPLALCPPTSDDVYLDTGGVSGDYGASEDITTTFTGPGGTTSVTATFADFDIEATWDYMRVYDGPIEDALTEVTTIGAATTSTANGNSGFTGTVLTGETFTTLNGGDLTFVFESDASVFAAGWQICIDYSGLAPNGESTKTVIVNESTMRKMDNSHKKGILTRTENNKTKSTRLQPINLNR